MKKIHCKRITALNDKGKYQMDKLEKVKYIILTVGLFFLLIASILFYQSQHPFKDSLETTGKIIQPIINSGNSIKQSLLVSFKTLTNQEIQVSLGPITPLNKPNTTLTLIYSATEPSRVVIKTYPSFHSNISILANTGSFLILSFILIHLKDFKKQRRIRRLQSKGIKIKTILRNVEVNPEHETKGLKPYRIYTEWLNPNATSLHIFKSDYLLFDPSEMLEDGEVTVLIEKDNPSEYYLDLSFLNTSKKKPGFEW